MAVRSIAHSIRAGETKLGLAVGAESMSLHPRPTPEVHESVSANAQAHDCIQARSCASNVTTLNKRQPMGWTSEMVAQHYNVPRAVQDEVALRSHQRAAHAVESGTFADEIVPIEVRGQRVEKDDTVRPGVTAEGLAKLKPVFPDWGEASTTAGNASGIGDGAALLVLASRAYAEREGLPVIAKWGGCTVVGVEPRYMGIGPVAAIPKLLDSLQLGKEDVNVWEINEAFASQFAYCLEQLRVPVEDVNPQGGSIALTHPLGMTGARLIVTGLAELRRRNEQVLCTSMCIGSGMGAGAIIINEA